MPATRIPSRIGLVFAVLAFAFEVMASALYAAASGVGGAFDSAQALLTSGARGALLIRVGSLVDMLGYLCIVPVALYLRERYASARFIDIFTVAGIALAVIGSIGAVGMAAAGSPLIEAYSGASAAQREFLQPAFVTLYRWVVVGMWQTLESIAATVWLLGTATAARREGPRSVFYVLLALGVITGLLALGRLAGL